MALIKCKECGSQVSTKADSCPSCGTKPKKPMSLLKGIFYIFLIFNILFIVGAGACRYQADLKLSPEERAARNEINAAQVRQAAATEKLEADKYRCEGNVEAFVMAQGFVKKRLKSPSTAKFPYSSDEGVKIEYLGNCTHGVTAYVEAQNSFGALIRTRYYVEIQNEMGTDYWQPLEIRIDDQ